MDNQKYALLSSIVIYLNSTTQKSWPCFLSIYFKYGTVFRSFVNFNDRRS